MSLHSFGRFYTLGQLKSIHINVTHHSVIYDSGESKTRRKDVT